MSPPEKPSSSSPGFVRSAVRFLRDYLFWWLLPIIVVLVIFVILILLGGKSGLPFIYRNS